MQQPKPSQNQSQITPAHIQEVKRYLQKLQARICSALEAREREGGVDGTSDAAFIPDNWDRVKDGIKQGGGCSRVLQHGAVIEKGGVMFSHIQVQHLPATASARYPQLAGARAEAMGVSLVIHPKNPHVPTSHMNVRLFVAYPEATDGEPQAPVWWFGGGFDLTPFYPVDTDCTHWHKTCFELCAPFGEDVYPKFKQWCDDYFYLKHRDEQRGIGGLFFDDLNTTTKIGNGLEGAGWDFTSCFAFMRAVGDGYLDGILPIFDNNKHTAYSAAQRNFQLYRRGRYVEYNLVYDRGTLFGLQSGGRIESILVSLPNLVSWQYCPEFAAGSPEARLTEHYLKPRNWLS